MAELAPGDGPRCDARQGMCVGRRGSLFRITRPLGSARGQGGDVGVAAAVGRTNPAPGRGHIGVRLGGTERSRARAPVRVGRPRGDGHAKSHDRDTGARSFHAAARSEAAHRTGHAQAARQFAADAPVGPRLLVRPGDRAHRDDDTAHTRIAAHARAWRVRRPRAVTAWLRAGLPAKLRAAPGRSRAPADRLRLVSARGAPRPRRDGLHRRHHRARPGLHGRAAAPAPAMPGWRPDLRRRREHAAHAGADAGGHRAGRRRRHRPPPGRADPARRRAAAEPRRHPDSGRSADRVSGRRCSRFRGRPPAAGRPRALPRGSAPASDAAGGADDE